MSHYITFLKVAEEISAIEEANIGPRSWQMSGESGAKDRPINR